MTCALARRLAALGRVVAARDRAHAALALRDNVVRDAMLALTITPRGWAAGALWQHLTVTVPATHRGAPAALLACHTAATGDFPLATAVPAAPAVIEIRELNRTRPGTPLASTTTSSRAVRSASRHSGLAYPG
ncbi:DUF4192 family protein [Nocardia puris]|uniref:DUF4192 family protein n=1 Tax=Nocardia puris TaxID=208602 RepID=UPI002E228598